MPKKQTTYGAILEKNNALFRGSVATVLEFGTPVSSAIHKISLDTAKEISTHLKRGAIQKDLPLTYTLACICIESKFDPDCFNKNLGPRGSNPLNNPARYDIGLCQLNLRYLFDPKVPELATLELATEFAHDLDRAIPYFLGLQQGHVEAARKETWRQAADPRSKNPYYVAAVFYNAGRTGGARDINANLAKPHAGNVAKLEAWFAEQLGLPSVMADIL